MLRLYMYQITLFFSFFTLNGMEHYSAVWRIKNAASVSYGDANTWCIRRTQEPNSGKTICCNTETGLEIAFDSKKCNDLKHRYHEQKKSALNKKN